MDLLSSIFAANFGSSLLLKNRLESFCEGNQLINPAQISGRKGARTADHMTVIRFLIEKYALQGNKKLYSSGYKFNFSLVVSRLDDKFIKTIQITIHTTRAKGFLLLNKL